MSKERMNQGERRGGKRRSKPKRTEEERRVLLGMAKEMLSAGLDARTVADWQGLTLAEVKALEAMLVT